VIAKEDRPAFFEGAAHLIYSMTTETQEGVFVANVRKNALPNLPAYFALWRMALLKYYRHAHSLYLYVMWCMVALSFA